MGSGDFNVSVVVALVLGGLVALVLAAALALGGYGRAGGRPSSPSAAVAAPSAAASALIDTEGEYLLDTSELAPTAVQRSP